MAKNKDWLREAKKKAQKRATTPKPLLAGTVKATGRQERRMIDHHADILQNIEFAIVQAAREIVDLEDRHVAQALKSAILGFASDDSMTIWLKELIESMRSTRPDRPTDELWREGLQVVYASVLRHSTCRPGDTQYLDFINDYIL